MSHYKFVQSQQLNGYNEKVSSKEPMSCFPWSHVWLCSLCYDWCHIKLLELSAQRVRGQPHPVRNILVVSHKEGLGGLWPVDCLRYDGLGRGAGGSLHCAAPMNYEENQWRQEVTQGGWTILSPPDALFQNWARKQKAENEKERVKICPTGAVLRIL